MTIEPTESTGGAANTGGMSPTGAPYAVPAGSVPSRISRYTIVRVLGQGGMGTVYEAVQENPRRTVALKVIRAGALSPELLRRFEHESQVLGRLQHPGIAQIYEAGTVPSGQEHGLAGAGDSGREARATPFFAMEFIRGVPLTDYATRHGLTTHQRLELLAKTCDAVYHAHQKGVIHRDLKPANILVDESGQPKILDFGVARATDSDIQQTTIQTDIGQLLGTVPYMSPEQVSGNPNDLDTRSDVYALGIIAYELLAGRLPYDLKKKMIHEAARIIKEEEPTRLSSIDKTLRGDIETIVAKALEKEKSRRYQSAESLASDIRRYLKDEPITARPASTWYQAGKFARRNKGLVGGVALAFAVLLAGLAVSVYAFDQARTERDQKGLALARAEANEQRAKDEAAAAIAARRKAEAINEFVTTALVSSDPNQGGAQGMTVAAAMTQALTKLNQGHLKDQPATVASLLRTIAQILTGNGRAGEAQAPAERSMDIERSLHPGDHRDVAEALNFLAKVEEALGRAAEAEPLLVQALEMTTRLLGNDHLDVADRLNDVAALHLAQGRAAEAEPLLQRALEIKLRHYQRDDHPALANSLNSLAEVLKALGRPAEAEPLLVRALEMNRRLHGVADHPELALALNNLAIARQSLGHYAEAEQGYAEALAILERVFAGDHPEVAQTLSNLATVREGLYGAAAAEPLYERSLAMLRRLYSGDHPLVGALLHNLAFNRYTQRRLDDAESMALQALEMRRRLFAGDHPDVAMNLNTLALCRQALGDLAGAESLHRETLELRERLFGRDHPDVAQSFNNLGAIAHAMGRTADAEPLVAQALEMYERYFQGDHPEVAASLNNLASVRQVLRRPAEAEPLYTRALDMYQRLFPAGHPHIPVTLNNLAVCLAALQRYPEALARAQEAVDWAARVLPEGHPSRADCAETLEKIRKEIEETHEGPPPSE